MMGYNPNNIKIVSNGKDAVEQIKSNDYDICFMDIKMPIMNGLDASKHIRNLPNKPIIMAMSAGVLESDKDNCMKVGMDGYLCKPIHEEELRNALKIITLD